MFCGVTESGRKPSHTKTMTFGLRGLAGAGCVGGALARTGAARGLGWSAWSCGCAQCTLLIADSAMMSARALRRRVVVGQGRGRITRPKLYPDRDEGVAFLAAHGAVRL